MIRLTRTPFLFPALALVALFGTRASASLPATVHGQHGVATNVDPDPADCPFCGGNASMHVQRMDEMERVTLAMYTSLMR